MVNPSDTRLCSGSEAGTTSSVFLGDSGNNTGVGAPAGVSGTQKSCCLLSEVGCGLAVAAKQPGF